MTNDIPNDSNGLTDEARIAATVAAIPKPDGEAATRAAQRQDRLTKPIASLGRLEELAVRIAGITGSDRPQLQARLIVVAAGDHGVARQGVSAYPQAVTAQMVANFLRGGAAINVLADHAGARVRVVDAGVIDETPEHPDLLRLRLGPGTDDITRGPAMPRALAARSVAAGIELFEAERSAAGVEIVGCGEMGIGNSTAAAALIAAATGHAPRSVTGRGTGVDDEQFEVKVAAIEAAVERHHVSRESTDGVALLASLGGFEIGVLAGVYLGAAAARVPAVVDGLISASAALVAQRIEPRVAHALVASHQSAEPGHRVALGELRLEPYLDLGMRLGEGSGAALGITLCVAACRLLDEMATFDEAGVSDSDDAMAPEA